MRMTLGDRPSRSMSKTKLPGRHPVKPGAVTRGSKDKGKESHIAKCVSARRFQGHAAFGAASPGCFVRSMRSDAPQGQETSETSVILVGMRK